MKNKSKKHTHAEKMEEHLGMHHGKEVKKEHSHKPRKHESKRSKKK